MPRLSARLPKYRRHSKGYAFVELSGQRHYLGRYGSKASKVEYDRLMAEWLSGGRQLDVGAYPGRLDVPAPLAIAKFEGSNTTGLALTHVGGRNSVGGEGDARVMELTGLRL